MGWSPERPLLMQPKAGTIQDPFHGYLANPQVLGSHLTVEGSKPRAPEGRRSPATAGAYSGHRGLSLPQE